MQDGKIVGHTTLLLNDPERFIFPDDPLFSNNQEAIECHRKEKEARSAAEKVRDTLSTELEKVQQEKLLLERKVLPKSYIIIYYLVNKHFAVECRCYNHFIPKKIPALVYSTLDSSLIMLQLNYFFASVF